MRASGNANQEPCRRRNSVERSISPERVGKVKNLQGRYQDYIKSCIGTLPFWVTSEQDRRRRGNAPALSWLQCLRCGKQRAPPLHLGENQGRLIRYHEIDLAGLGSSAAR